MISNASKMLNVKNISNMMGGIGSTSIASTISTTIGIAKEDQDIVVANCRRSDTVKDATAMNTLFRRKMRQFPYETAGSPKSLHESCLS